MPIFKRLYLVVYKTWQTSPKYLAELRGPKATTRKHLWRVWAPRTNGKRTKQPQVTDLTSVSPFTVGLPVTSERYWASFQVTGLFHSATIFLLLHMYLLCETSPGWLSGWRVFFFLNLDLVGKHSAPMYLLFAPYKLISRPPRVFRRLKRRSCLDSDRGDFCCRRAVESSS